MKAVKRGLIWLLAICMAMSAAAGALADAWICASCGQEGNNGNFCSNCGAAKTDGTWTCINCYQTGNTGNFCSNCGAAKPTAANAEKSPSAQAVDDHLEQIPGETDRVKVCLDGVQASSFIANKKNPSLWIPENAVDNDESTCWQFSAKKGLKGKSWLELIVGDARDVDEIWFKNGFWAVNDKGGDQYIINARLKDIRVEFLYSGEKDYQDPQDWTLKDESRNGWQVLDVGHREQVEAVRIGVWTVYKGKSYPNDVCLSEVMLVQNAPAAIAKEPAETKAATVYESRPEISGCGLLMKLATRSGPGTEFDEPGTFFGNTWKEQIVRVLGKSWDGSVWWVLVDFSNGGKGSYRVWTGAKRVDVDLNKLKEIYGIGQGTVSATTDTFRGPGGKYARANVSINEWKDVVAYGRENGYVEVEFEQGRKMYRLWVPESDTSIDWGTDFSGNS